MFIQFFFSSWVKDNIFLVLVKILSMICFTKRKPESLGRMIVTFVAGGIFTKDFYELLTIILQSKGAFECEFESIPKFSL